VRRCEGFERDRPEVVELATVVERSTRFTGFVAIQGRDKTTVTAGLSREMTRLLEQLHKSLTWDRGTKLADHKTVTVTTGLDVYFADPHSPW
jgi:IS30 family transposase